MDFFTHLIVGIAGGRLIFKNPNHQKAFILGCIAPDFDVFIGWIPSLISELVILSHRGLFHTLFFMPIVIPVLIYGTRYLPNIKRIKHLNPILIESKISLTLLTWLIGTVGPYIHITMDLLNPQGVLLLFPISSERFSLSLISFFDPVVTIMAGGFFFWYLYKKVIKKQVPSIKFVDRYTRVVTVLFIVIVIGYGFLQVVTINNYQPETSTVGFFTFQRWIIEDQTDSYDVKLVNQFTQQIEKSYSYQKIIWNQSQWSKTEINSAISDAQKVLEYQNWLFRLNPDTRLIYNVTTDLDQKNWIIKITDVFQDVQVKHSGLNPFNDSKFEISLPI
ncbi:MAG: hypothetical protein HeimC3_18530 [Candidatus Heimdallarchaeota archaeon LC_3]|nr:MAG: hypothetical protein HeimC3_18530 [Candidatus Heimdallarchaeota archaeon LC_3]